MILITGGAGFVGSNLAIQLAERHPDWEIVALDNLHRPGSELNPPRLEEAGVRFVRGDVREPATSTGLSGVTALVECSAEPSATERDRRRHLVRLPHQPDRRLQLPRARPPGRRVRASSSRPAGSIRSPRSTGSPTRRARRGSSSPTTRRCRAPPRPGSPRTSRWRARARSTAPPSWRPRSLIEEYREMFGLRAVVDRCGVIAGPWQMGKVDQGVFAHWLLSHRFGRPLSYIGYGGTGKQVRDLLHVADLADLVEEQLAEPGALGRRGRERGRRPGEQPLAAGDDRALPRAHRRRRSRSPRSPRGAPATCRSTSRTARASSSAPTGVRRRSARETLADLAAWIDEPRRRAARQPRDSAWRRAG